jgi:hypothetical protein
VSRCSAPTLLIRASGRCCPRRKCTACTADPFGSLCRPSAASTHLCRGCRCGKLCSGLGYSRRLGLGVGLQWGCQAHITSGYASSCWLLLVYPQESIKTQSMELCLEPYLAHRRPDLHAGGRDRRQKSAFNVLTTHPSCPKQHGRFRREVGYTC